MAVSFVRVRCVAALGSHKYINQARCPADFFNVIVPKLLVTADTTPQFLGQQLLEGVGAS